MFQKKSKLWSMHKLTLKHYDHYTIYTKKRKSQCNNHPFRGHPGSCFHPYSKVQTLLHLASHLHENSLAWKTYPGRGPACPVNGILPNGPSVSCASFGESWCWIWHKGGPGVVGECYLGHGSSVSGGLARKLLFPWQLSQPHLQF